MSINIEDTVNEAIIFLNKKEDISEEEIDNYTYNSLNKIRNIRQESKATVDELKRINHLIKTRVQHRINKTCSTLVNHDFESWFMKRKGKIEFKYWDRYKIFLESEKHFTKNITDKIDDVVDDIMDLVGDPTIETSFQRRGLIIGDVQSGKTSNFIGLMCKACDVGYKLIVVLAGTSDVLRKQTQSRVDEGLIGVDSDNRLLKKETSVRIGAALYGNGEFAPVCVTSLSKDFNKNIANQMGLKLNQTNDSIVFIIKKNVSVLNNLNSWIKSLNQTNENGLIDSSLLVIDDEADYASINTNKEDKDPTRTNQKISELLGMFCKTSYLGFTATPYANVFINPENNEDMLNATLFPKDYIYCLDAPSNYIGARNIFGKEENHYLKTIESDNLNEHSDDPNMIYNILPLNHKKEALFDAIPISLKQAIQEFFIANTIRDLRGDINSHRSMLINISRFVMVHERIQKTIEQYINSLSRSIIYCGKLDDNKNDKNMNDLKKIYKIEYARICEDAEFATSHGTNVINWDLVKKQLNESTSSIVVRVVNQKTKDEMDFNKNKKVGLRVIAIGGIALSRGVTLEGLMISYFYRNSAAYDTLMQMGRWFGYREGYEDLCRIWMTDDTQENYISINRATEELRESIIQYKNSGLTPMDFGIKVRADSNLLITARNKMRFAKEELIECTLSSKIVETSYLYSDEAIVEHNYDKTKEFLDTLLAKKEIHQDLDISKSKGFKDVDSSCILEYMDNMKIPFANIEFENEAISSFISDNYENLAKWDVAFIQGSGHEFFVNEKFNISLPKRVIDIKPNTDLIRISGKRCRVGGPNDAVFGLDKKTINQVKNKTKANFKSSVSQRDYFAMDIKRKPLLAIYLLKCDINEKEEKTRNKSFNIAQKISNLSDDIPLVALSIGIPGLGKESKLIKYATNKIEQGLKERNIYMNDEDFDDE